MVIKIFLGLSLINLYPARLCFCCVVARIFLVFHVEIRLVNSTLSLHYGTGFPVESTSQIRVLIKRKGDFLHVYKSHILIELVLIFIEKPYCLMSPRTPQGHQLQNLDSQIIVLMSRISGNDREIRTNCKGKKSNQFNCTNESLHHLSWVIRKSKTD